MSGQHDDLLLSLQSSLRNTLYTFGPSSQQYADIKKLVDEHIAKASRKAPAQEEEVQIGDGKAWSGDLVIRVKGQ